MLAGLASYPRESSIAGHSEKIKRKYEILTVKVTVAAWLVVVALKLCN